MLIRLQRPAVIGPAFVRSETLGSVFLSSFTLLGQTSGGGGEKGGEKAQGALHEPFLLFLGALGCRRAAPCKTRRSGVLEPGCLGAGWSDVSHIDIISLGYQYRGPPFAWSKNVKNEVFLNSQIKKIQTFKSSTNAGARAAGGGGGRGYPSHVRGDRHLGSRYHTYIYIYQNISKKTKGTQTALRSFPSFPRRIYATLSAKSKHLLSAKLLALEAAFDRARFVNDEPRAILSWFCLSFYIYIYNGVFWNIFEALLKGLLWLFSSSFGKDCQMESCLTLWALIGKEGCGRLFCAWCW